MSIDPRTLQAFLGSLRATRSYLDEPVPSQLVERWLDVARWCGSSRNSQPWRFVVVRDRDALARLSALGEDAGHLGTADLAVALAAAPGPYPFSTVFDLGRVAQSLMLAAAADGVGSCIAVLEPESSIETAKRLLSVPSAWRLDLAIGFGYPDPTPVFQRPDRPAGGRLDLDRLVAYEQGHPGWDETAN